MLIFNQTTPSSSWTITHDEGLYPVVTVTVPNNGKQEMILPASVVVVDATTVKVNFTFATTGVAMVRAGGI